MRNRIRFAAAAACSALLAAAPALAIAFWRNAFGAAGLTEGVVLARRALR